MNLFVGMDVSLEKSALCVLSEHGEVVKEAEVASEPEAIHALVPPATLMAASTLGAMNLTPPSAIWVILALVAPARWDSSPPARSSSPSRRT